MSCTHHVRLVPKHLPHLQRTPCTIQQLCSLSMDFPLLVFPVFLFLFFFSLFVCFWLRWVLVAACGLFSFLHACGARAPGCTGFTSGGVWIFSSPETCGIFLDQGSNPRPLHGQVNPEQVYHQRSCLPIFFKAQLKFLPFLVAQSVTNLPAIQETTCNAGDLSLITALGRFPGEGNSNPL